MRHVSYTCDACGDTIEGSPDKVRIELHRNGSDKVLSQDLCTSCLNDVLNAFWATESKDGLVPKMRKKARARAMAEAAR